MKYYLLTVYGDGEILWTTLHTTEDKARAHAIANIHYLEDEDLLEEGDTSEAALQRMIDDDEVTITQVELVD